MLKTTVAVCESQPLMVEGLKTLVESSPDLEFAAAPGSLPEALECARRRSPSVLVIDKSFGGNPVLQLLEQLRTQASGTALVVWSVSMAESEALRFIHAGARGILRKMAGPATVLACVRAVAAGSTWFEKTEPVRERATSRAGLTARELQVVELVGQGMKNREVADELGIRPGTVKVHLKHIFEKMGVQGRYGLALTALSSEIVPDERFAAAR